MVMARGWRGEGWGAQMLSHYLFIARTAPRGTQEFGLGKFSLELWSSWRSLV